MAFTTRGSLLSAVRRGDEVGWNDFFNNYKPLILLRGGDRRLTQTEKEDLVQLVMLAFFNASQTFHYDKTQGRFRDYLKRIIDHKAYDIIRKRKDGTVSIESEDFGIEELPAEAEDHWETEWKKYATGEVLKDLQEHVSPLIYQVFTMLTVDELPVKEVAKVLGITANAVYVYKHAAIKKAKELLTELDQ